MRGEEAYGKALAQPNRYRGQKDDSETKNMAYEAATLDEEANNSKV